MNAQNLLFAGDPLDWWLQKPLADLCEMVENWNPNELLATADADLVERLVTEYSVECPTLHRDQIEQLPIGDGTATGWAIGRDASGRPAGKPLATRRTQVIFAVPFDGEPEVFRHRPSRYDFSPPSGRVREQEIEVWWLGDQPGATFLRRVLNNHLDRIERYLDWARFDIQRHNASVRVTATRTVEARRAKLLSYRHLEAGLGFPMRTRSDAAKYAVPVSRRKIAPRPRPSASKAGEPEPFLADAQYEAALRVLITMRNALERSPSTTEKLTENGIRDLLLVSLNAQFEGNAAGEVFNGEGKTDILIRDNDINVFIAECKIWDGPKTVSDALDQLLGYLVSRDTKAALLLFIRDADAVAVTDKAVVQITRHPNYKRRGKIESDERCDFVIHANGDPGREIHLALLPFLIARRKVL